MRLLIVLALGLVGCNTCRLPDAKGPAPVAQAPALPAPPTPAPKSDTSFCDSLTDTARLTCLMNMIAPGDKQK